MACCVLGIVGLLVAFVAFAAESECKVHVTDSSEQCNRKLGSYSKQGAALIQTNGLISKSQLSQLKQPPAGIDGLSAFDRDYLNDANNPLDQNFGSNSKVGGSTTSDSKSTSNSVATDASAVDKEFANADKDGDGIITEKELSDAVNAKKPATSEAFKRADLDGNGVITQDEFVTGDLDDWEKDLLTNDPGPQYGRKDASMFYRADTNGNGVVDDQEYARVDWLAPAEEEQNITCVTQEDSRASSMAYTTAAPGSLCVFGVDARDEGAHCIMEDGQFGSFGWCWTDEDQATFGSCSPSCPLFGPMKVLSEQIDNLDSTVKRHIDMTRRMAFTTITTTTITESSVANIATGTRTNGTTNGTTKKGGNQQAVQSSVD